MHFQIFFKRIDELLQQYDNCVFKIADFFEIWQVLNNFAVQFKSHQLIFFFPQQSRAKLFSTCRTPTKSAILTTHITLLGQFINYLVYFLNTLYSQRGISYMGSRKKGFV